MVSAERVYDALGGVIDPELGLDFVTLGLIYAVEIPDGEVQGVSSPGCPIGLQVPAQMVESVGALDGVERVSPRLVFLPRWSRERLSEDSRFALGL